MNTKLSPESNSGQKPILPNSQYLPLISVIVPVYNVAKVLERCVESIRKQTYPNLEIILIDDGSTDMSGSFCDIFAKKDPRIRAIHQSNQGLSAARNTGIRASTGKWLTFVDSDDTVHPEMIDLLHRLCFQNKLKLSICSFHEIAEGSLGTYDPTKTKSSEKILTTIDCLKAMLCEEGFSMSAWGKLYARELFDLVEFPEHRLYEDVGTTYKLVLQCDRIAVSSAAYYNYYQNPTSITKRSFSLHKMDLIDLTDQMCDDILTWSQTQDSITRQQLVYLTQKRRMHARFSILRQIVMVTPQKKQKKQKPQTGNHDIDARSLKNAESATVKYLKQHKPYILKNPLATRRDRLAMFSLLCGLPVFKFAWQKYSSRKQRSPHEK